MDNERLNVAVIFGGCSPEYNVSLESAYSVLQFIDRKKYNPVMIGISKSGRWFYFTGDIKNISEDSWCRKDYCIPAMFSTNLNEGRLLLMGGSTGKYIKIDVVFPVLHGKNGEDGTVQGLIQLTGIPMAGCGVLSSALCMDKDKAHRLAGAYGIRVPKAIVLDMQAENSDKGEICTAEQMDRLNEFILEAGYPLFVKPVKAGSSYGITRVTAEAELKGAVKLAFKYDDEVIIEENIDGFEVGCAVIGNDTLIAGIPDEIELSGGFFDFTEKYTLKTSAIHVPARISEEKRLEIQQSAMKIYKILGCSGFARVDMFLTSGGELVFNEINTIPGFTEHSRFPNMMKAAGISFEDVISKVIELAVEK